MRLLHFTCDGVLSPVLDSQVLTPLRLLGDLCPEMKRGLLVLTSIRHKGKPQTVERESRIRSAVPGAAIHLRFRPPLAVPLERRIWVSRLRDVVAEFDEGTDEPILVHCRGEATAAAAAHLKRHDPRLRVVLDLRGAQADEVAFRGPLGWWMRRWGRRNRRAAFAGADAVNAVSSRLLDLFRDQGLLRSDLPTTLVGCCVDTKRFLYDPAVRVARRKELGFDGKFVVCYCGAMSHWQRPDALAGAFAAIRADMPDAHFFALTREPDPIRVELARVGVAEGDVTVRSAPHAEVASYLMAADVALLLRDDTLTNRVAAPVKYAEYLCSGLPVILTPYIGDYGEFTRRQDVGRLVEMPLEPQAVLAAARDLRERAEREGDAFRRRCSDLAAGHLSWGGQIGYILRLYETLVQT